MLYVPLQLNSGLLGSVKKVFHGESPPRLAMLYAGCVNFKNLLNLNFNKIMIMIMIMIYDLQNLLLITGTCNTQAMSVKRPYGIELDMPFEQRPGH